ncbi:hypothetical protein GUITHDRAFT_72172 [Guillardia theta CCMP2712]|uniref:tRNA/rRNA methyltransferase SpoU type domain-containing protein n=1 Tax=Guillardia theta (strain CCMP2712) TaxID=905079 RepID=L1J8S0_GUITC|nr:hypothetical protein GUITHDRAFT_72172 [Guillardia theta CCMP2712]EKX44504.1 hypothetical protein GUITHDRAFT_72172 [Guillardia theta CCMP2712]|eukprot:XP_005831484.1 hypothetical protein GUITHDRAFT_72172 [Guillardia theta CCMP2712]
MEGRITRDNVFPLVVILDNLRSAFNVGSIFRTSECLGIESIILCGYTSTPEDSQTSKAAMGMDKIMPWKWMKTVEEAIAEMKARNYTVVALETVVGCPDISSFSFPRTGCALVLGNERYGIDSSHVSLCDAVVKIPCRGIKNSLNVASAYGICAYEITRQWSTS